MFWNIEWYFWYSWNQRTISLESPLSLTAEEVFLQLLLHFNVIPTVFNLALSEYKRRKHPRLSICKWARLVSLITNSFSKTSSTLDLWLSTAKNISVRRSCSQTVLLNVRDLHILREYCTSNRRPQYCNKSEHGNCKKTSKLFYAKIKHIAM